MGDRREEEEKFEVRNFKEQGMCLSTLYSPRNFILLTSM